ncbi:TonB-dependent receptor [Neptunomonas sp. XY-337]|uniref:TonB-dependent receptor n=1 Tax=Neptunomonas sp. XY-337 TaxID=2561897 RepID=UPI00197FB249|nr:TonB-dependent receptor [Neptunomonas sp. XY-337]
MPTSSNRLPHPRVNFALRRQTIPISVLGVIASVAATHANMVFADAEPTSSYRMETITVTASGHEADVTNTPHAVTIIDRSAIERSSADNLGDLLRGEPGLAVAADGAWGMNPVIRGLKKEQVVIMVDGIRLNSAQPYGAIASLVDLNQVERVEVVKGPASVLYGSGAIGGVINIVTQQADFTEQPEAHGNIRVGGSSADNGIRTAAGLAISNADHALNLNLSALDVDDYSTPAGDTENSGYQQKSVAAKYRTRLSEVSTLSLNLQHQVDDDVWYPGSAKPHRAHGTQTIRSPQTKRSLYEVAFETALAGESNPQLRINLYQQDIDRTIAAFSDKLQRDVVRTDVSFSTVGSSLKLDMAPTENHLLTLGADLWKMTGDPDRYMDTNPPHFNNNLRNDPFDKGRITSAGIYLQDEVMLDKWKIKAGVRYDRITGKADAAAGLPPQTPLTQTNNTFSWSLGTVYNHTSALNPYVNLARAYRAPDMRERFESSPRGDGFLHQGNPLLDPEESTTLEVGIKGSLERTRYTLAAYHSRINDYIIGRVTGAKHVKTGLPIKVTENLAEVTLTGIEATLDHDLGNDLLAFANFSYLRGENKYDNEPLAGIPPAELSLGLRSDPSHGWNWNIAARIVAEQDRVGTQLTNGTEDTTSDFTTVDLGLGYRFAPTQGGYKNSISLAVNNLLDEEYHEHLTTGLSGSEPLAPGINAHLTWNMAF